MKKTVGTTDRVLRGLLAAGAVAGAGVLGFTTGWGIALLGFAAAMTVTGLTRYCVIYSLLGIDTLGRADAGTPWRCRVRAARAA
jgi:hypothetical protein